MSGPESAKPDDALLDELLAGQGAVRQSYRAAAREKPPAALDAAILQMAGAAAATASRQRPRRRRWQAPIAAAAVLVLSFGVLLQWQRDPVAQREVMASRSQAASAGAADDVAVFDEQAAVEARSEAAESRDLIEPDTKTNKPAAVMPVSPQSPRPPPPRREKQHALPRASARAVPLPPPASKPKPAMAGAAPPAPVTGPALPTPDAGVAGSPATPGPQLATSEMALRHSQSEQRSAFTEALAPPSAPVAKVMSAPVARSAMARRDAETPAAPGRGAEAANDIEQWAQSCRAQGLRLTAPVRWRGLVVQSFTEQIEGDRFTATLRFAADTTRETIAASLGPLAARAELADPQCAGKVVRSLRPSAGAWTLSCECPAP